jgi:UDP-N-acetylmuramate--alanine ligase
MITERLKSLGVTVYQGHDAANVSDAELVVASAAVPMDNPELAIAREQGLRVLTRAQLLGMLMEGTRGIAVAGTHGKTTTTSMLAGVLVAGGLDPTILIGGDFERLQGNARLGQGEIFLTEACEAFNSFLELHPTIAVVTNVEADHLEFHGSIEGVIATFRQFLAQIVPEGCAVLCIDSPHVREMMPSIDRRMISYGFSADANLRAEDADLSSPEPSFRVVHDGVDCGCVTLRIPGKHNVQNALAALAVGFELGVGFETMFSALADFRGAERRFDVLGTGRGITVVDDYAHHPTEVRATLEAARAFNRRVVAVFQPHQYSRTVAFMDDFAESLSLADVVVLTEIFAAREQPMPDVSASMVGDVIRSRHPEKPVFFIPDKTKVAESLLPELTDGDLVIVMGAGDIRMAGERLVSLLGEGAVPFDPSPWGSDGTSPSRPQAEE